MSGWAAVGTSFAMARLDNMDCPAEKTQPTQAGERLAAPLILLEFQPQVVVHDAGRDFPSRNGELHLVLSLP